LFEDIETKMVNEEEKLKNENNGKAKQIREEMFHMVEVK
jgi:hypothetical protein